MGCAMIPWAAKLNTNGWELACPLLDAAAVNLGQHLRPKIPFAAVGVVDDESAAKFFTVLFKEEEGSSRKKLLVAIGVSWRWTQEWVDAGK